VEIQSYRRELSIDLNRLTFQMEQKIFQGLVFALNSHTTFKHPDNELVNAIYDGGGTLARNVTKEVTHLVCSNYNNSFRIQQAERYNAHLIDEEFISESIKQGKRQDESSYWITREEVPQQQKTKKNLSKTFSIPSSEDEDFVKEQEQEEAEWEEQKKKKKRRNLLFQKKKFHNKKQKRI